MDRVHAYLNPAAFQQYLSRVAKYLALFVLVLNVRSLPFGWHVRVFGPLFHLRFRYLVFRLGLLLHPRKDKKAAKQKWLENLSPIGENLFDKAIAYKAWAGLDDCDYNCHLSNSCYPKVLSQMLDAARLKAALVYLPSFLRAGGWIALGATHFQFLREIPIFSTYEIRMSFASWDSKWIFLVIRFVTLPKKRQGGEKKAEVAYVPSTFADGPPFPNLHTPASGTATPIPSKGPIPDAAAAMKAFAARTTEPDGAILNCICVNELVFKHGRITVPPALVFAADGLCGPAPPGEPAYSAENPPPHWAKVQEIIHNGGVNAMTHLLRGGWKDVPEGERWWEQALGGQIEERRAANMELVYGVRRGMEGAREITPIMPV
ncbi:hypothetical protein EW146_g3710 [Bondarzewia mesenterica]|uniref:Thioesterase domain-containing protein n=1 Tax=Bondarzewia mesenterica TaxID=1095465 RepID=A0A4S4LYK0_9AGAM|nr:hypothetical protein EW146_g3710 [Bondarzewia mesenterica]